MVISMGKSMSVRFIAILLVLIGVGQGIGAVLFLGSIRSGFMDSLHDRMRLQIKQTAAVMSEPVFTSSMLPIETYIDEAMKDKDVQSLKVINKDGVILRQKSVPVMANKRYLLTQQIHFLDETIGTVELEYAATTIDASMRGSLFIIPFYQAGMLLLVALVLIRLFNRYVKRPVNELNQAIEGITGGDLTIEVPVHRDDEIGTIAVGVRFLKERLAGTVDRISSISDKVAGAIRELNDTFDRVREVAEHQNRSTETVSHEVREAGESQRQIVANTEQLLSLSGDNLSALLEMQATSEAVAETTDSLSQNLQDSYSTLAELAQSAKEITRMADDVASFVAEASSSIEEIYRSVRNAEDLVNESTLLSTQTTNVISGKGMEAIDRTTAGMKRIANFIDALMAAIEGLGTRSRDIGKVLGVIEDVTEKSRLLSLNAQIIAAQAGEHGKGFAVVAQEMKQLSDKAALSTREIAGIVGAIQSEIGEVVAETRESVGVVREGEAVVAKTAEVLHEILATSRQATELSEGIERASREQTGGLQLVVTSTEQIRNKIQEVYRGTSEQEKSTSFLLKALDPIKDGMETTRRATVEQAGSSRFISTNIEQANQKNSDIAVASAHQQQLNQRVIDALHDVVAKGHATVAEVNGLIPYVTAMREDLEVLRTEMTMFKTANRGAAQSPAAEPDPADGSES
jgi:methyl-accepting chemotaxis protein